MKISRLAVSFLISIAFLVVDFGAAMAGPPPNLPAYFYGSARAGGFSVPPGTVVSAWVGGAKVTEAVMAEGQEFYSLTVGEDDPATPQVEGGREGDTVTFKIGALAAHESGTWHSGASTRLDLTADLVTVFLPFIAR